MKKKRSEAPIENDLGNRCWAIVTREENFKRHSYNPVIKGTHIITIKKQPEGATFEESVNAVLFNDSNTDSLTTSILLPLRRNAHKLAQTDTAKSSEIILDGEDERYSLPFNA